MGEAPVGPVGLPQATPAALETAADVKLDIERTRVRMSDTLAELERKLNVGEMVREHPWPALGLAAAAGFLLSGSSTDIKAAAATVAATKGASSKLGEALDDVVASLLGGVHQALDQRVNDWVGELKVAIGATANSTATAYDAVPDGAVAPRAD